MKKLLTFVLVITICFLATPVFAYGVYGGSCTCTHDIGTLPDEAGFCDPEFGCTCSSPRFSPSLTENNCKIESSGQNADNNNNHNNNSNNYYSGSCTCQHSSTHSTINGICDRTQGCTCTSPYTIFTNNCVLKNNNDNGSNNGGNISIGDSNVDCGVIADITRPAIRLILIAAPIILIVMGGVDILTVVTSGDEKGMKKAWSNLIKRFIICVVIFLLPLLVNFIIGWTTFDDLTACM